MFAKRVDYAGIGSARSDVSMASGSVLRRMEARLDRALSGAPRLKAMRSIARRHSEEAFALGGARWNRCRNGRC